jgi:hypothetical protein
MVLIYNAEDDGRGRPLAIKGGGRVDEGRGAAQSCARVVACIRHGRGRSNVTVKVFEKVRFIS